MDSHRQEVDPTAVDLVCLQRLKSVARNLEFLLATHELQPRHGTEDQDHASNVHENNEKEDLTTINMQMYGLELERGMLAEENKALRAKVDDLIRENQVKERKYQEVNKLFHAAQEQIEEMNRTMDRMKSQKQGLSQQSTDKVDEVGNVVSSLVEHSKLYRAELLKIISDTATAQRMHMHRVEKELTAVDRCQSLTQEVAILQRDLDEARFEHLFASTQLQCTHDEVANLTKREASWKMSQRDLQSRLIAMQSDREHLLQQIEAMNKTISAQNAYHESFTQLLQTLETSLMRSNDVKIPEPVVSAAARTETDNMRFDSGTQEDVGSHVHLDIDPLHHLQFSTTRQHTTEVVENTVEPTAQDHRAIQRNVAVGDPISSTTNATDSMKTSRKRGRNSVDSLLQTVFREISNQNNDASNEDSESRTVHRGRENRAPSTASTTSTKAKAATRARLS